jgi:hypothetical protein
MRSKIADRIANTPKEIPMIFTPAMAAAIVTGTKTQTRRMLGKKKPPISLCPYGKVGDALWVRENFKVHRVVNHFVITYSDGSKRQFYYKDFTLHALKLLNKNKSVNTNKWIPSIFLLKELSRIWLQVADVSIERLRAITEEDAIAEGVGSGFQMNAGWPDYQHIKNGMCTLTQDTARMSYASLWDSINYVKPKANGPVPTSKWSSNPWVWVIKFKVLSTTGKPLNP